MLSPSVRPDSPEQHLQATNGTLPTVRYLPDWFPGTGFKAIAKKSRDKFQISVNDTMKYVKDAMKVSP